jgi:hypothetical protein
MRRTTNGSLAAGRRLSHLMSRPSNRLSVPLRGEISNRAGSMFGGASSVIGDVPQAALSPQERPPRDEDGPSLAGLEHGGSAGTALSAMIFYHFAAHHRVLAGFEADRICIARRLVLASSFAIGLRSGPSCDQGTRIGTSRLSILAENKDARLPQTLPDALRDLSALPPGVAARPAQCMAHCPRLSPGREAPRRNTYKDSESRVVSHNTGQDTTPAPHPFPWLGPITRPPWEIGGKCKQRTSESNDDCEDDRGIPKHTTPQSRSCTPLVS